MKKILIGLILCFFCTSCNMYIEPEEIEKPTQKPKREISETLNISVVGAESFCPYYENSDVTKEVLNLIYEPLFSYDGDFKLYPVLAEAATASEDGMSVTVYLKKNISWHDGTQFLADNVLYTVSTLISSGYNTKILSAEKIDEHTVKINFTMPVINASEQLTFPVIKGIDKTGTGEFMFFEKTASDTYILKRFKGEGTISNIKVINCPDEKSAKQLFEIGETDVLTPSAVNYGGFNSDSSMRIFEYPINKMTFLELNPASSVFFGESTRQALMYIINKADITDKLLYKKATPADFPINPASVFYPKSREYKRNTKTAEELLKRDGWERAGEKLARLSDGKEQSLLLRLFAAEELMPVAEYIKDSFEKFGIGLEIVGADAEYDLILDSITLNSASDFSNIRQESSELYSIKTLIRCAPNDELRKVYYEKCADIMLYEAWLIPLYFENTALVAGSNIEGDMKPSLNNAFYGLDNWNVRK